MTRVSIVDSVNNNRVLGSIPTPHLNPKGPGEYISFPIYEGGLSSLYQARCSDQMATIRSVSMRVVAERSNGGWVMKLALATDATLQDLRSISGFEVAGYSRNRDF